MTINLSDYDPALKYGANIDAPQDVSVVDDLTVNDDLAVSGLATIGETLAVTGVATFTAAPVFTANPVNFHQTDLTAATITVTAAQTGGTFLATKASATQTYTLPAVAAGLRYTFVCGSAAGEILIDQVASEVITITSFAAVGADADTGIVAPAGGTGIKNTAATNAVGDSVTLFSDGVGWYGIGITSGIWASQ